ncbi:unnamed protein product [Bathycoccus prasinos]
MQNTGVMTVTPARKVLQFEKTARTPLSERSISDNENNDENDKENKMNRAFGAAFLHMAFQGKIKNRVSGGVNMDEKDDVNPMKASSKMEQMEHELAQARAEIAILKEKKNNPPKQRNTNKSGELKSPLLLPSPPVLQTPLRFRRERDSFRKELKMISQNAEQTEAQMLEQKDKEQKLSQENEAWLLKALNEKTRALKIAAKANNASEKELMQAKETTDVLERSLREQTAKVLMYKQRLVKNEQARKKLESKVGRYRDALKDASLRNEAPEAMMMPPVEEDFSVDTAMSNESYCGENKVAINIKDNVERTTREENEGEEEEEVNFRVFPEQMMAGVPATPAMFQFPSKMMDKNSSHNEDEYETNTDLPDVTTTTMTPGGEVIDFYGRPKRDTKKDVFVILSVWAATIAALISMGTSSSLSSSIVVGERVVVKGFGFFC